MRLRPVTLVVTFALGLLAGPLPAKAQQAGKVLASFWQRSTDFLNFNKNTQD